MSLSEPWGEVEAVTLSHVLSAGARSCRRCVPPGAFVE